MGQADELPPHVDACSFYPFPHKEYPEPILPEGFRQIHRFVMLPVVPHNAKEPTLKGDMDHRPRAPDTPTERAFFLAPKDTIKKDKGKGKKKVWNTPSHRITPWG